MTSGSKTIEDTFENVIMVCEDVFNTAESLPERAVSLSSVILLANKHLDSKKPFLQ